MEEIRLFYHGRAYLLRRSAQGFTLQRIVDPYTPRERLRPVSSALQLRILRAYADGAAL